MRRNPVQTVLLCLLAVFGLVFGSLQVVSGAPLVYEGFSGSADGSGDEYQFDVTLRSASDARTGFTGAWNNPPAVAGQIDYDSRNDNSDYTGLTTGTAGALEIYESRAGKPDTSRGISRGLSYTTPDTNDIYFAFCWKTSDPAALSLQLNGTRAASISVSTNGILSTSFNGGSAVQYTSSAGAAHQDGTWNLFVMKFIEDSGGFYDDIEVWLNPTISGGSLGTPSKSDCRGIVREQDLSNPTSFTSVGFNATVGTGDEVRFDEFYITTNLTDIVAPPDTDPPAWTTDYPKADTATSDGFTARAAIDEPGTAYYVVVADGATAPSASEVKAGTGASGSGEVASGSISLSATDTESTASVTGLSSSTAYDVYFVAEDDEGTPNVQDSPQKVDVTTTTPDSTAPTWTASYPQVSDETSFGATARASINEEGTAYYVVVSNGVTAPTSAQVTNGVDYSGVTVVDSGSIALTASTANSASITGLLHSAFYDIYFVAADDEAPPNLQSSPRRVSIATDTIITPTNAVATSTIGSPRTIDKTIDGSDLSSVGTSGNILSETHTNNDSNIGGYWLSADTGGNVAGQVLTFTLPEASDVDSVHLWGYERLGTTSRSMKNFDMSFSFDGGSTFPVTISAATLGDFVTPSDPIEVQTKSFSQQSGVTDIRISNISNFGDANYVGLSEIRFGGAGVLPVLPPSATVFRFQ